MNRQMEEYYEQMGLTINTLKDLNKKLKIPTGSLTKHAKNRREEALNEAIDWPKGPDQDNRIFTKLYQIDKFSVGVTKPGKEAAPDYKLKHYKTGERTNNPNDMLPLILNAENERIKNLTFEDMFSGIEELMHSDLFGLELMGTLIFRAAFMLDHKKNEEQKWRYYPQKDAMEKLEKRIPIVSGYPVRVFLHFLEILSLNEDIKTYTLGHNDLRYDYGRINTLLTFANLIAVLLNRRSLANFAGQFARPPSGMAPLPKTERGGLFDYYPLLSPKLFMYTF